MAWPATALTTYTAGSTPAIKAVDLNAFQNAITGIINGTYSLRGGVIDGTGGAVVVPRPGALTVSALLTGTTLPTPALSAATLGLGSIAQGWARVRGDGVLMRGLNVYDVARTAGQPAGDYTVRFHNARADPGFAAGWATVIDNGTAPAVANFTTFNDGGGRQAMQVRVFDLAGALVDRSISCGLFAE